MFLSLFCISISIRICFLDIPCIIFSFMTWVKVTWGLRISLRRIQVHFIINRVYDRYNVWIEFLIKTCYIFVMTKATWDAFLSEKCYIANWPSLHSTENMCMSLLRTANNHHCKKIGNLDILLWISNKKWNERIFVHETGCLFLKHIPYYMYNLCCI